MSQDLEHRNACTHMIQDRVHHQQGARDVTKEEADLPKLRGPQVYFVSSVLSLHDMLEGVVGCGRLGCLVSLQQHFLVRHQATLACQTSCYMIPWARKQQAWHRLK